MKITWDFTQLEKFGQDLVSNKFDEQMKIVTKKIAEVLLRRMKSLTPIETGELLSGWDGNKLLVTEVKGGFEVLIINKSPNALYVNDGHRVRNRKDGPYLKVKHRVKVPTAHQWQNPVSDWYVFGHFFVERSILQLENSTELERILNRELQKWWKKCYGK